jgi:hypothetical protein
MYVDLGEDTIRSFQTAAPVDVVEIARAFGIQVWEGDPGPGMAGKLFRDPINGGDAGYSILVNAADSYVRKRFTVAHEIAHFFLHRDRVEAKGYISDDVWYRSGMSTREEAEANRMAADILMPRPLIAHYRRQGIQDLNQLESRI